MGQNTQNTCKFKPGRIPTWKMGGRQELPSLSVKLLATDGFWERKVNFI